ncbi:MAG: hypothetical protein U0N08_01795 [Oscillospiraceae bacterium]
MLTEIISGADFSLDGLPFREICWQKPPDAPYGVYLRGTIRRGADLKNCISEHSISLELYSRTPDPASERKIEAALDALPVQYSKTERQWLNTELLYMTIYDFEIIRKD